MGPFSKALSQKQPCPPLGCEVPCAHPGRLGHRASLHPSRLALPQVPCSLLPLEAPGLPEHWGREAPLLWLGLFAFTAELFSEVNFSR